MTKGKAQISKSELPQLIENIEANGGDASELRAILVEDEKSESPEEITNDELVEYNRKMSTVEEGDGLICTICHKPGQRLTSGACDSCFRLWTLDCKAAILKMRSKDGSTNRG